MTDERKDYLKEYRKAKLKRIPLDVPLDMYEDIKECAEFSNAKVNTWIKNRLKAAIEESKRNKRIEQARGKVWYTTGYTPPRD